MNITVPFKKLEKIVHLADIHIRLFKRHEEYRAVFQTLYTQLKSQDLKNGIIVVAGDILHAKTDMSPEMVQLASEFLSRLADIAPTFVIAGNHDLNLSNMNRLDSLTPIISNLSHRNLFYLKHSGVYRVADTDIAVMSILDSPEQWPSADDCKTHRKIALFHGPVHGAVTDAKFVITNRHVNVGTFRGFDMVLLGDIHKYQVLQQYDRAKSQPIIVYSSSLIQQNHGELLTGHGWCLWDVPSVTHTFQSVPNEYGYHTVELTGSNFTVPTGLPKNLRLRLFTGGADQTVVKKAISVLRKHYSIVEMSISKSRANQQIKGSTKTHLGQLDITNVNTQNTLITNWITSRFDTVDSEILKKVMEINKRLNGQINHDDQSRNIHWKPLELKFSNMFSYGEDNLIRFNQMSGLYGIFAPNASGKSSSIDALMFCLYDKTPRAFRGDHIINNRKDQFECQLKFQIDNDIYYVKRIGTRKKNGDVKVDVSFWKQNDDGTITSLNGEDRRDTNANIRNYVGSYDDFVLTALSSQNSSALFIDKSHSERKDLLIQFMGLNLFDTLYNVANDEMKEVSGQLKRFKNTDFTQTLADTQTRLDELIRARAAASEEKDNAYSELDSMYNTLKYWQGERKALPAGVIPDLKQLDTQLTTISRNIGKEERDRDTWKANLKSNRDQLKLLKGKAELMDEAKISENYQQLMLFRTQLSDNLNAQAKLEDSIERCKKVLDSLDTYKFNQDCPVCVENFKSVIDQRKEVEAELNSLFASAGETEGLYIILKSAIDILETSEKDMEEWRTVSLAITKYEHEQELINSKLKAADATQDALHRQLKDVEASIALYYVNEEIIQHNKSAENSISTVELSISDIKGRIAKIEKKLMQLHGDVKVCESTKSSIMQQIKEAEVLEDTYEAYEYYMSAIGRDGVPYDIMSKAIPQIESEINAILSQIVEFTISLEVDGKNIVSKLNYDNERIWPLENSSGMERFVSSIAIRVALMNVSNLPKPNFLIIDEGFGTLDAENLSSMGTLFSALKAEFDFILIISHLDSSRDMVDEVIEIRKEDGYSYINV